MISEDFAFKQMDRISGLDFFPSKAPALLELVKALRTVAPTEQDAERVISEWLEENRAAPKPADFYAMRRTMKRINSLGNDPYAEYVPEWKEGPKLCSTSKK